MFQTLLPSLLILTSLTPTQATVPNKNGPYNDPPAPGFGTWNLSRNTSEAVAAAVEAGYRHFDCATAYNNQKEVGAGIQLGLQRTGLKRGDLWVTSKIWGNRHGGLVGGGIENNLGELGGWFFFSFFVVGVGVLEGEADLLNLKGLSILI